MNDKMNRYHLFYCVDSFYGTGECREFVSLDDLEDFVNDDDNGVLGVFKVVRGVVLPHVFNRMMVFDGE